MYPLLCNIITQVNRAMPNLIILLQLLPIVALVYGSNDSSDEELSRLDCSKIDFSLDLTGVGFGSVPNGFVKNQFLTELILDENQIPFVTSETFSHVPKLIHLSLASNKFTILHLEPFSEISELKTLILNGNCKPQPQDPVYRNSSYYYYHPTTPKPNSCNLKIDTDLHSLTHLYVENNNIEEISTIGSGSLPALTHLHLSRNPIAINEETLLALRKYMPALTHLFLKDCNILRLDASKLSTVKALYLDNNHISAICNEFCLGPVLDLNSATPLTTLSISHNEIARVEVDSFKDTTNLITLDLSHNQISNIIDGTFDKLQNLEYLNLENNNLQRLNAVHTSRNLPALNSLLLGKNDISHVSNKDFENMLTLKTLMLNDNNLSIIETETFSNLSELKELSLAGNSIERIHDILPTSGSLITLNLDRNYIESTEAISLVNVSNLITLSLKDNPLTTINVNWLADAPKNLTISLGNTCP